MEDTTTAKESDGNGAVSEKEASENKSNATAEKTESAGGGSVSKYLSKFDKPDNVALIPGEKPGYSQQKRPQDFVKKGGAQVTIETPERASVSKYLAKFDRPDNVALIPDKSLLTPRQKKALEEATAEQPDLSPHQQAKVIAEAEKDKHEPGNVETGKTESGTTLASKTETGTTDSKQVETQKAGRDATKTNKTDMPDSLGDGSSNEQKPCNYLANSTVPSLPLANEKATKSLRVCCYGSSSNKTPQLYLRQAAEVGYLLGIRGHTCVNGAGRFGCMAAMNEGAAAANGHIVGVIHKMFLVDGDDYNEEWGIISPSEGGPHVVFNKPKNNKINGGKNGKHPEDSGAEGPIREMLVAGGKDLQERKRLLVEGADALIVLPGGPGTYDELWEMACARHLGLSKLPIVCVNVEGFYEPFRQMLERAWKDELIRLEPNKIIHFADNAHEAVKWVEEVQSTDAPDVTLKRRKPLTDRNQSVLGSPVVGGGRSFLQSMSSLGDWTVGKDETLTQLVGLSIALLTGVAIGFRLSETASRR